MLRIITLFSSRLSVKIDQGTKLRTDKEPDAILDAVGGSSVTIMFNVAAPISKMIVHGRFNNDNVSFSYAALIYKNLTIEGFGIDNWIKNKIHLELNSIWQESTTQVHNGVLQINYGKPYSIIKVLE